MNQTCPCPLGHPGMWGSPLCARYQAGPAHAQVSISWFCPVICRFQGTEPCVEMPQVCSAWTTHSDVLGLGRKPHERGRLVMGLC